MKILVISCMKKGSKYAFLILFVVFVIIFACLNQTTRNHTTPAPKKDTLFVEVRGHSKDGSAIANALKDSLQEGEFVAAAYTVRIPLVPKKYVNDYVSLYTPAQTANLDSLMAKYEKRTSNEIALITIDTQWVKRDSFDVFVKKVHNTWAVGKRGKNNGIVIGICPGYRLLRISNGNGIMKELSDAETKAIIDSIMAPEFKTGHYFEGTRRGILEIIAKLNTAPSP